MNSFVSRSRPYFVVTVDTEADDAWKSPRIISLTNLSNLPKFQELCEKYKIIPTYLVTYECATRDEALSILKPIADSGNCEIGHHLHIWTTPPFQQEEGGTGVDCAWVHGYQSELPDDLFVQKCENLYFAIEKSFGNFPTSHRAGRWGIDQRTVEWLISKNFMVDTSIVPLNSYHKQTGVVSGGPCFFSLPCMPYLWSGKIDEGNDNASIVEIPVSVEIPKRFILRLLANWMQKELRGKYIASRIFRKFGGGRMLRPDPSCPVEILLNIAEAAICSDFPVLNLMLHSSELTLGCSPFTRTVPDHARVWGHLEEIFKYVSRSELKPVSLSNAGALIRRQIQEYNKD